MGKPTGFLEYERKDGPVTVPKERIKNFKEFHGQLPEEEQRKLRAGRENGNKIFNKSRGRLNTKLGIPEPESSEKP